METTTTLKTTATKTVNELEINFTYEREEGEMPSKIKALGSRITKSDSGTKTAIINATYNVSSELLNFSSSNITLDDADILTGILSGISEILEDLNSETEETTTSEETTTEETTSTEEE